MSQVAGLDDYDAASAWLPGDQQLLALSGTVIQPNTNMDMGALAFARSSYLIAVDGLIAAGASQPFMVMDLNWTDPATGTLLAHERWVIPTTQTNPAMTNAPISGRGPSKAAQLNIVLWNYDVSFPITVDLAVYQSTRAITRDDIRSLGVGAMPGGFTNAASDAPGLIPGYKLAASLASGATVTRICGLYSGQAFLQLVQTAAQALAWTVTAIDPASLAANWPVVAASTTSAATQGFTMDLPRRPVAVAVTNNGASPTSVSWCLTALELTS